VKLSSFLTRSALLLAVGASGATAQTLTVTTLAGSPHAASEVDGPDVSARFSGPYGVAINAAGTLYVVDHGAGTLRQISAGQVTTLAPHFGAPYGVAADSVGNLYVTDSLNDVVDKVAPSGLVTILAGQSGVRGTADGVGTAAQFTGPTGIALDGNGNLLVADTNRDSGGSVLRKITPDGSVSTIATGFVDLRGVAVASGGVIYVADDGDNTIRAVASDGTVSLFAGVPSRTGSNDGAAATARFNLPSALAIDGNNDLFVADYGNSVIREISPSGNVTTVAGLATIVGSADGTGSNARFYTPSSLAIDSSGSLYISDTGNDTIRVATGAAPVSTVSSASTGGSGNAGGSNTASVINLSVRAMAGAGDNALVVGFVTSGSGNKNVLLRGVGPALAQYGVSNALSDPQLTLYSSSDAALASNEGWGDNASLAQTMSNVGAFALPANSADSALAVSLAPGLYTAEVTSPNGSSGIALAEIYDEDGSNATAHLVNVSSRAQVGIGGASSLIAGFVVSGPGSRQLLIRAVGPTLSQFGVSGALSAPQLTIYNSGGTVVASQAGWGDDASVIQAESEVGAFSLPANSPDCAMLVTLPTGTYSAQVTGVNNATGVALIEVYAVP
jgi:sugar lactone lactonase YvrE